MRISNRKESGFTLIEMLAVIVVIMILAGMLYPALRSVREGPKKALAKSDIVRLELAIQAFYDEYGSYPPTPRSGGNVDSKQFYAMLNGNRYPHDGTALATGYEANNPRQTVFMEFDKKQLDSTGIFLDPWGNPYLICLDNGDSAFGNNNMQFNWGDTDDGDWSGPPFRPANDGIVRYRNSASAYSLQKGIAIYSWGPNKTENDAAGPSYDDISNWY